MPLGHDPHVLSDEEIEMYLKGDRRDIDRLLLFSINRIIAVLIPHAKREDERDAEFDKTMAAIGGAQAIIDRAKFVDSMAKNADIDAEHKAFVKTLIERQNKRNIMMEKVSASNVVWVSIAFLGYLAYVLKESIVNYLHDRIGG
jgi:frataxin-like iron-binding protein CyaY